MEGDESKPEDTCHLRSPEDIMCSNSSEKSLRRYKTIARLGPSDSQASLRAHVHGCITDLCPRTTPVR